MNAFFDFFLAQIDAITRYRFELIERATRVPQSAPRNHRNHGATSGNHRRKRKGNFVAHSTRRVFVDFIHTREGFERERIATMQHGIGIRDEFVVCHTLKIDGHEKGGSLIIGDIATDHVVDKCLEIASGDFFAIALEFN